MRRILLCLLACVLAKPAYACLSLDAGLRIARGDGATWPRMCERGAAIAPDIKAGAAGAAAN